MEKRTLWTYWGLEFISNAVVLFHSTYVLYLLSHGLDYLQINLVNTVFMATVLIMEIPTGLVADIFGRKKSLIISFLFSGLAFAFYSQGDSFGDFILAETIAGIGVAFFSGAMEAWVIDSLKASKYTGSIEKVFSRGSILNSLGIIIGGIVGGYIAGFNLGLPFLLASIGMFSVAGLAAWLIKESPHQNGLADKGYGAWKQFRHHAGKSLAIEFRKPQVLAIVCLGIGMQFAVMGPNMLWQPYFSKQGLDVHAIGWLFGGMMVAVILGNIAVEWLGRRTKQSFLFSYGLVGLALISFLWLPPLLIPTLTFYLLHEFGRGMYGPLKIAMLNRHVSSERRATVLSFESTILKVGAVAGLLLSGWLAREVSINFSWAISGLSILLLLVLGSVIWRRRKTTS